MKTLKTLYIFYQGFFKYVEIKTEFKEKSKFIVFTGKEIAEFQANANAAFRREVKFQLKRLSEPDYSSVTALLNEIKLLNDECTFVKGRHTKNEIIRDSLGRHQLLDFSQLLPLEEYLSFTNTDDSREINLRIEKILKVYHYLQCGSDDSSDIDGIYPYVGTYEYSHETRDGYKVAHFSISSSSHEKALDIEILSEFRYSINGKYYCLPNKMCCNNELKLWIEPTVISYKNFVMVDEDE